MGGCWRGRGRGRRTRSVRAPTQRLLPAQIQMHMCTYYNAVLTPAPPPRISKRITCPRPAPPLDIRQGLFGDRKPDGVEGGLTAHGGFLNDIWVSTPKSGSQAGWNVVGDESLGRVDTSEVIYSQMTWRQSNPGRISPATWPTGAGLAGLPMTYKDWIMCQEFFEDLLTDEEKAMCVLPDECRAPDKMEIMENFNYGAANKGGNIWPAECSPQAVWKK